MTDEQIDEYTVNASVLNELIRLINDRRSRRKAHGHRAADFWDSILVTSANFREYPGHTLPAGKSQLQNKINDYKRDGGRSYARNKARLSEKRGESVVSRH
jgi:hypothetical protein